MSMQAVCTACGKTFDGDAAAPQPICPECRASAVSEHPIPVQGSAPTAIQSGLPKAVAATERGEGPADIRRPPRSPWNRFFLILALGIGSVIALYAFLVLACGWGPAPQQMLRSRPAPSPVIDGAGK